MPADSVRSESFASLLEYVVDNRGRTCPTAVEGLPLIATNCISNDRLYPSMVKVRFVDNSTYRTWFRAHPLPGDILFVTKGSPGQTNLVPDPVPFCIAQDMVAVRANKSKVEPSYLFAVLRSAAVQTQIENMHVGTMIPHFKKGDFDKLWIPVPSRPMQQLIGSTYMALLRKMDLNQRINETLETMARALFKDWFVDFGPSRAKAEGRPPYLTPALWPLFPAVLDDDAKPVGWKTGTLANFATLNPESWSRANYPVQIRYVDLSNTKWGTVETTEVLSKESAPSRAQRILRSGDTIVGTVRPGNGSYALVGEEGLTGSTGFAVLRPNKDAYRTFTYLAATSSENIERLAHLADGGAYPAVRPEAVVATPLLGFHEKVLQPFSEITNPLMERIEANKRESRTLAGTRDLLLPKLMSGEIRLRDAEKLVRKVS